MDGRVWGGIGALVFGLFPAALSGFACTPRPSVPQEARDASEGQLDEGSTTTQANEVPPVAPVPSPDGLAEAEGAQEPCALPEKIREPDWPRTLTETTAGPPSLPDKGTRTIAVLPDTQYYINCKNDHFSRQAKWIANELGRRNVNAVIQLGDLTEHNTEPEWIQVKKALEPLASQVPLFLATGNHDYGDLGKANHRTTLFQEFFSQPEKPTREALAEAMKPGDLENAYFRIPFGGVTLSVLVLEWSPRQKTVAWARGVLAKYPRDRVIFVTHAYLFHDGTRYDYDKYGKGQPWNPRTYGTALRDPALPISAENWHPDGAYDGEMLWNELLKDHGGVFLTLNGHVIGDGTGVLSSRGSKGNLVHQVLVNYQMLDEGGLGYLRLVEIDERGETLTMKTYSPSLDKTATAADQAFSLKLEPPLR